MQVDLSPQNHYREQSLHPSVFPPLPNEPYDARRTEKHSSVIPIKTGEETTGISPILQLAWAIVIAAYTDSNDVVFGFCGGKPTGPSNPVSAAHMNIQPEQTVDEVLKSLNTQDDAMSPLSGSDLPTSSVFPNILVVKNDIEDWTSTSPPMVLTGGHFDTCPFLLTAVDQQTEVHVHFDFDPEILSSTLSQIVMDQLVHVVNCIQTNPEVQLKTLLDMSTNGPQQTQAWNSRLQLRRQELGVHDVITKSEESPNTQPVCDWDGKSDQSQLSAEAWTERNEENVSKGEDTPPTSRNSSISPSETNSKQNFRRDSSRDHVRDFPMHPDTTMVTQQPRRGLLRAKLLGTLGPFQARICLSAPHGVPHCTPVYFYTCRRNIGTDCAETIRSPLHCTLGCISESDISCTKFVHSQSREHFSFGYTSSVLHSHHWI